MANDGPDLHQRQVVCSRSVPHLCSCPALCAHSLAPSTSRPTNLRGLWFLPIRTTPHRQAVERS